MNQIKVNDLEFYFREGSVADQGAITQVFANKDYELKGFDWWPNLFNYASNRSKLIIDAGANIGTAAIWFANYIQNSRVVAIEPEENNYNLLMKNTRKYKKIRTIQGAVASTNGIMKLHDPGRGEWGYMVVDEGNIPVTTLTIPSLMLLEPKAAPYICKIDIEGGEKELFSANTDWVDLFPLIIIELHEWMLPGQNCEDNFRKVISKYNFEMHKKGENTFCFNKRLLK